MNTFGSVLRMSLAASALTLSTALPAAAPQWQGLNLVREAFDSIEGVNGVPLRIERFTGKDVPVLLRRWLVGWRADAGTSGLTSEKSGDWHLFVRLLRPSTQEVLQVRGKGVESELLWSRLALSSRALNRFQTLRLPAGCKAGPAVQGRDEQGLFDLSSAVCGRSPSYARSHSCDLNAAGTWTCVVPLHGVRTSTASALVFLRRMGPGAR